MFFFPSPIRPDFLEKSKKKKNFRFADWELSISTKQRISLSVTNNDDDDDDDDDEEEAGNFILSFPNCQSVSRPFSNHVHSGMPSSYP